MTAPLLCLGAFAAVEWDLTSSHGHVDDSYFGSGWDPARIRFQGGGAAAPSSFSPSEWPQGSCP